MAVIVREKSKFIHHNSPSGTINKAKWLLSESKRDLEKLYILLAKLQTDYFCSDSRKSWLAAQYMAWYCIMNNISNVTDEFHFTNPKYSDYQARISVSSKRIPWYELLVKQVAWK